MQWIRFYSVYYRKVFVLELSLTVAGFVLLLLLPSLVPLASFAAAAAAAAAVPGRLRLLAKLTPSSATNSTHNGRTPGKVGQGCQLPGIKKALKNTREIRCFKIINFVNRTLADWVLSIEVILFD